jgi:DNA-binding MarR family transcriptional regulator
MPGISGRSRKAAANAEIDERWLRWIGRFKFVDVRSLMLRFSVSDPATWRRLRRLEDAGLLRRQRCGRVSVFSLTTRATSLLRLTKRKSPRASDRDLVHELAIAQWVAELEVAGESAGDGLIALTERDLRERHTSTKPYCAYVAGRAGELQARWPDAALELPDGQLHIYEIELTDKGDRRLSAILRAYRAEPRIAHATFFTGTVPLARRLARIVTRENARETIDIRPVFSLPAAEVDAIDAVVMGELSRLF